ncbi:hypothetical protein H6A12_04145 [Phocea massiliensis]|uniref:SipW-cognate class signal peptide n=1 Tax=Merdimmobilis hominis TaxID=2897707 RepID=A0A938X5I9_9FIRM|nr:right-handed parallel beta-helix repeat-containing protein [Merdimmobilis hominis]MBM6920348.1 hypothetical protein [Merdimmobilis hominis]
MKATKKHLYMSAVSLMLCAVMLLGTTFAWFTDSVTNTGNVIQAGNLDINATGFSWNAEEGKWDYPNYGLRSPLITQTKWEPGQYNAVVIKVSNYGATLAADVDIDFSITENEKNLADALWYKLTPIGAEDGVISAHVNTAVPKSKLSFVDPQNRPASEADGVITMSKIEDDATEPQRVYTDYHQGQYAYYLLEYGMYTSAGNDYMGGSFNMTVTVKAKQAPVEEDGFGNSDYDANATYAVTSQEEMQDAIDDAKDGDVIALSNDLTVDDETVFAFDTEKSVTIDLSGNTITYNNPQGKGTLVNIINGADVTLQNGSIEMTNPYYGLAVRDNSSMTLKGVTVNSGDGVIFSHGKNITVVVEDSVLSSTAYCAVYHNGSYAPANITLRNTKILSGGVYISNSAGREKQTLTIEGSTIYGPTAVEMKHTNATITDSTLIGTSAVTGSGSNNNGGCTEGYALAVTGNGVNDLATGTVTVTNCKFYSQEATGEPNGYYFVYKLADGASVTIDGKLVDNFNSYGK